MAAWFSKDAQLPRYFSILILPLVVAQHLSQTETKGVTDHPFCYYSHYSNTRCTMYDSWYPGEGSMLSLETHHERVCLSLVVRPGERVRPRGKVVRGNAAAVQLPPIAWKLSQVLHLARRYLTSRRVER